MVPVLVVDGVGPIQAIKHSPTILKRTWGESVGGEGGLGIISFLLMLSAFLVIPLAVVAGENAMVLGVLAVVVVLYILVLSLVFSALNTIFRTGTYINATTGRAPTSMDPTLLQTAFHRNK